MHSITEGIGGFKPSRDRALGSLSSTCLEKVELETRLELDKLSINYFKVEFDNNTKLSLA